MKKLSPVKLYLVSGFLGSGKTTLMKRLIPLFEHETLGVLVNEFGSIGMDGAVLDTDGIQLIEINNGSVFCACLKKDFVETLKEYVQKPIDTLLIECSGMADPSSMNTLLNGLAPYLERPYDYRGCLCMVDSATVLDYLDMLLPLQNQITSADLILVNKTDLVDTETLDEIHDAINELNPSAFLYNTTYAQFPPEFLDSHLTNLGHEGESMNKPSTRLATFLIEPEGVCTKAELEKFYGEIVHHTFRVKGFVQSENGFLQVEGVNKQLDIQAVSSAQKSVSSMEKSYLVVISREYMDLVPILQKAWGVHCKAEVKIKET